MLFFAYWLLLVVTTVVPVRSRQRSFYDYGDDYDRSKTSLEVTLPPFPGKFKQSPTTQSPFSAYTSIKPPLRDETYSQSDKMETTSVTESKALLQSGVTLAQTVNPSTFPVAPTHIHSEFISIKVVRLEMRVPSTENAGTDGFKRLLSSRLSFVLSMLQPLAGIDSFLTGKPYPSDPYTSDILVFAADRVNEAATDRVYVDFAPVLNSTFIDANTTANLMQFKIQSRELSQLLGYAVVGLPKSITRTIYSLKDGVAINKLLRIEFENFAEQNDAFYYVVNNWLNDFVLSLANNLTNSTGELSSVMIIRMNSNPNANRTTVDFTINLGYPSTIDRSAGQLARLVFSTPPYKLQSMIDFTILSGGYVLTNGGKKLYVPLYTRRDDYYLPAGQMELDPTMATLTNSTASAAVETDQRIRIVFKVSDTSPDNKENVEKLLRIWVNNWVVPFVKNVLNTNFNASAQFFNTTTSDQTMALDFAVLFQYQQFPLATKASELVRILFIENSDKIPPASPFAPISGGPLVRNSTSNAYIYIPVVFWNLKSETPLPTTTSTAPTTTTPAVTTPITTTPITTTLIATTPITSKSTTITTQTPATVTRTTTEPTTTINYQLFRFPSTSPSLVVFQDPAWPDAPKTTTATTPTTTFSIPSNIGDTDQVARIVFEQPKDSKTTRDDMERTIRLWLVEFVTPFIQKAFGTNYTARSVVINSTSFDRSLSVDFAIFFFSNTTMVVNATELAVELFSTSFGKVDASAPYTISSGGYLVRNRNSTLPKSYIIVYSLTGSSELTKPAFEVGHLLQLELRVPSAVDVKSNTFKQLISNRLRGVLLPILQQPAVSENILLNSQRYIVDPNIYDIPIVDASRSGGNADPEKVAVQFAIIDNSSLLNAEVAASTLALNMQNDKFQRDLGFSVLKFPTAVTQIKPEPVKEPESKLWIIAAVLVPCVVVIVLINICILCCCHPCGQQKQPGQLGLPATAATSQPPAQQAPFLYYYQPLVVPPTVEKKTEDLSVKLPETSRPLSSSPEGSIPSISPPARVTYQLFSRPRVRKARRRIRPENAMISQVASSLLREALRNLSADDITRIRTNTNRGLAFDDGETGAVTDEVCQTESTDQGGDKAWTREYEQSLLRLASLVVSPSGIQVPPKQAVNIAGHCYMTIPEHGELVSQALKSTAQLAAPTDPNLPPLVTQGETKPVSTAESKEQSGEVEYLEMNDTQVKQLEKLNALFTGLPPVSAEVSRPVPVKREDMGEKPAEYADEHDVIVDSLRPGVPPRRLLEAIRAELENYGKKQ